MQSRPLWIPLANSVRRVLGSPPTEPLPRPLPHGERGDLIGEWGAFSAHGAAQVTPLPVGEGPGEGFFAKNSPVVSFRAWEERSFPTQAFDLGYAISPLRGWSLPKPSLAYEAP